MTSNHGRSHGHKRFGIWLADMMWERKLSALELAERLEVTDNCVKDYIYAANFPKYPTLIAICWVLGCADKETIEYLWSLIDIDRMEVKNAS